MIIFLSKLLDINKLFSELKDIEVIASSCSLNIFLGFPKNIFYLFLIFSAIWNLFSFKNNSH